MNILITNISSILLEEAISKTGAEKVIFIQDGGQQHSTPIPTENIVLEADPSVQLGRLISSLLESGDNVLFALESNTAGLEILNAAKEFEQFKRMSMYVVKDGHLDHFKACLC